MPHWRHPDLGPHPEDTWRRRRIGCGLAILFVVGVILAAYAVGWE